MPMSIITEQGRVLIKRLVVLERSLCSDHKLGLSPNLLLCMPAKQKEDSVCLRVGHAPSPSLM